MKTPVLLLATLAGLLFLPSCASIMHGTTQEVSISSSPSGALVTVNGVEMGSTPLIADLKRKNQHLLRIEMDGYEAHELAFSRSVSGWVVGNILFGGIIGLAVDAITGGLYKLSPEQVAATLEESGQGVVGGQGSDQLLVFVVLRPHVGWEPIATLERN